MEINVPKSTIIKETAYETLARIAAIQDDNVRADSLRTTLNNNNALAIVVQRTYHPDYNFDLPEGPPPAATAKKSGHDEFGPFYNSIRKWEIFRKPSETTLTYKSLTPQQKEIQFASLYESVSSLDADLLVGVKDKKLPWDTLSREFVVDAVPELFPYSFRNEDQKTDNQESTPQFSRKEECKRIMLENPGLARKDYINMFTTQVGVAKATAGAYYQEFKNAVVHV